MLYLNKKYAVKKALKIQGILNKKYNLMNNTNNLNNDLSTPISMAEFDSVCLNYNDEYGVVCVSGSTWVLRNFLSPSSKEFEVQLMMFKDFKDLHANKNRIVKVQTAMGTKHKTLNTASAWLKHPQRKEYDEMVFKPGKDLPESVFNLWRGFSIKPIPLPTSRVNLFWEHVLNIICNHNEEAYQYLRHWMAHSVQKTGELPRTAIVLMGQQGIGKGVFLSAFQKIFGGHFMEFTDIEDITGRFNGHLKDKVIIHANEATWGGDKRKEGSLKGLITEPYRKCEMKGKDAFTVDNYARLIVSSNNDWVVPAAMDDRRYIFFNVSAERKGNQTYFKELMSFLNDGGYEAVLNDLLTDDIRDFNPTIKPSISHQNAADQVSRGMNSLEKFIEEWLQDGGPDALPQFIQNHRSDYRRLLISGFHESYLDFHKQFDNHSEPLTPRLFSNKIMGANSKSSLLPVIKKTQVTIKDIEGKTKRPQAYIIPNLSKCREHWENKVMNNPCVWDDAIPEEDFKRELVYPAEILLTDSTW
mgnify:CR=1 FL=1